MICCHSIEPEPFQELQPIPSNRCFQTKRRWDPFFEIQSARVGFVLRDWEGMVIMATSMHEHQATNLADNEAIAILRGIQHYLNQGISNLLVESDCQVVSELLQLATPNSTIGNFLIDIRDIIS